MKWSPQQANALNAVSHWYHNERKQKQVFRLFGFAGTGKTTLARHFAETMDTKTAYAAYTNKAALALYKAGCHGASTIHSLIYHTRADDKGNLHVSRKPKSDLSKIGMIIIDECSMVYERMGKDLESFGIPILVLGDPAQLPPVEGTGYFTNTEPDIMLTEIHRQAKDNPIIYMATRVREKNPLEYGTYGDSLVTNKLTYRHIDESDQVLAGKNATRKFLNTKVRKTLGHEGIYPVVNDKLICLRNEKDIGLYNGGLFTVNKMYSDPTPTTLSRCVVNEDDDKHKLHVKIHKCMFNPDVPTPKWKILRQTYEFDYGYTITAHKAQGSQWDEVTIIDESWCFREYSRNWLYTAITRAANKVVIVDK